MFRFQAISFFLLAFLLSALVVKLLWNGLRRDFPNLPRLSYGRAVAGVFLWGLLFIIVLTMISGARELMTPGAWRKQGFTYKLADNSTPIGNQDGEAIRRQHFELLRTALWQFAATHNGRFPTTDEITAIPRNQWEIPDTGGLRYLYVPGRSAGHLPELLVYEPEIDTNGRFVLETNGDIRMMSTTELRSKAASEKKP